MNTSELTPIQEVIFLIAFLALGGLLMLKAPWLGVIVAGICALLLVDGFFLRRHLRKNPRR